VLPPGDYECALWRTEVQSSPHRVLQGGTTTWFGALDLFDDL